jgi:hypothetical protein
MTTCPDEFIPSAARELVPNEVRNPLRVSISSELKDGKTFTGFLTAFGTISLAYARDKLIQPVCTLPTEPRTLSRLGISGCQRQS